MKSLKLQEKKIFKKQKKQEKLLKQLDRKKIEDAIQQQQVEETPKEYSTVSIAIPGSVLENAQSPELRSYLAGQIARAACIFRIDEVIIFDDICSSIKDGKSLQEDGSRRIRSSCLKLARILQYLECPQYLRKDLFSLHKDLKYSGLLNPLDAPHHLRQHNTFMYREGVVTDKKAKDAKERSFVNVGLLNEVLVNKALPAGIRVTVKLQDSYESKAKKVKGEIVSPTEPRLKTGIYWGYNVRIASSLSEIFTQSPYKGGYDLTIGTSDKGSNIYDFPSKSITYNHSLIVFGGLNGLEAALKNDSKLENINDPKLLFEHYINVIPNQGSRTIRTEEAILIAMGILKEKMNPQVPDIDFQFWENIAGSSDTGLLNSDLSKFN